MKFLEDAIQNATSDRGATWSSFIVFFLCVCVCVIYILILKVGRMGSFVSVMLIDSFL